MITPLSSLLTFFSRTTFPLYPCTHANIIMSTNMLISPTKSLFSAFACARLCVLACTLIHTEKQRNEYISRYVTDVNDLDRYAESAFSPHISVEVSYEENCIHYICRKIHFRQPIVTSTQKSECRTPFFFFFWTVTALSTSQRGFWVKRVADRERERHTS